MKKTSEDKHERTNEVLVPRVSNTKTRGPSPLRGKPIVRVKGGRRGLAPTYYTEQAIAASDSAKAHVRFFHEFIPPRATAQTRRHTKRGTFLPPAAKKAAALLLAVCERYAPSLPFTGALTVSLFWTWPGKNSKTTPKTTRPDLDNLAKLALDAMTKAGFWLDDAQVVDLRTAKFIGPIPGLAVTVEQVKCKRADEKTTIIVEG